MIPTLTFAHHPPFDVAREILRAFHDVEPGAVALAGAADLDRDASITDCLLARFPDRAVGLPDIVENRDPVLTFTKTHLF